MYPQPRYFKDAKEISYNHLQNVSMECFNEIFHILKGYTVMYNGTMEYGVLKEEYFFFMDNPVTKQFWEYISNKHDLHKFIQLDDKVNNEFSFRTYNILSELIVIARNHNLLDRLYENGVYYLYYKETGDMCTLRVEKTYLVRD